MKSLAAAGEIFSSDVIGVKIGIGLNKMQINSIELSINFIDNSIHVYMYDIPLIYNVHVDFQLSLGQWRPLK